MHFPQISTKKLRFSGGSLLDWAVNTTPLVLARCFEDTKLNTHFVTFWEIYPSGTLLLRCSQPFPQVCLVHRSDGGDTPSNLRWVEYKAEGGGSPLSPGSASAPDHREPTPATSVNKSFIVKTTMKRAEKTQACRFKFFQYEEFLLLTASTVFLTSVLKVIHHGTISCSSTLFIICKWFPTRQVVCKDQGLSFPFIDLIRK